MTYTLEERYNLRKVLYAVENYETLFNSKEHKYQFKTLLNILKNNGKISVDYNYSQGLDYGRCYSHFAFQCLSKKLRNFLLYNIDASDNIIDENYPVIRDIDMVSSAPSILMYLADKYGMKNTKRLTQYVKDKNKVFQKYNVDKTQVNMILFDDKRYDGKSKYLFELQEEIFEITEKLITHKDFKHIKTDIQKKKYKQNKELTDGSLLSNIIFKIENELLQSMKKYLIIDKYELFATQFDGLFVYDLSLEYVRTINEFAKMVGEDFGNEYFKLATKPITTDIIISNDYKYDEKKRCEILQKYCRDYDTVKSIWESSFNATLIKSTSSFFVKEKNVWYNYKRDGLLISYSYLKYEKTNYKNDGSICVEECPFITDWCNDEKIQKKTKVVSYYDETKVMEDELNINEPFSVNTWELENYTYNEDVVNTYKDHLKSLVNYEEKSYEFLEKWIAHLFQYPDTKTGVCPIITGSEGTGKDTAIDIIASIMGKNKKLCCPNPERDVWGSFNGVMSRCCLVQLSEIDRNNTNMFMNKIKDVITSPIISINEKGMRPFEIASNHNFIVFTNNELPFNLDNRQRRFAIYKTTDKNIGNAEYFNKLYEIMDNKNDLKSIYEYFMKLENVPLKFKTDEIAISEYHQEMAKNCSDDLIDFIKHRANEKKTETETITTTSLLKDFITWRIQNHLPNKEWNSKSLGIRISNLTTSSLKGMIERVVKRDATYLTIHHNKLYEFYGLDKIKD